MSRFKTITREDLRKNNGSGVLNLYVWLPETWEGTVVDILKLEHCPARDRVWAVLHKRLVDDRVLRLFACACARETIIPERLQHDYLVRGLSDFALSQTVLDICERYARGKASLSELKSAGVFAGLSMSVYLVDIEWAAIRAVTAPDAVAGATIAASMSALAASIRNGGDSMARISAEIERWESHVAKLLALLAETDQPVQLSACGA